MIVYVMTLHKTYLAIMQERSTQRPNNKVRQIGINDSSTMTRTCEEVDTGTSLGWVLTVGKLMEDEV